MITTEYKFYFVAGGKYEATIVCGTNDQQAVKNYLERMYEMEVVITKVEEAR